MTGPHQPHPGGDPWWNNPPPPVDPQAPVNYPDYPQPYPPPPPPAPYGYPGRPPYPGGPIGYGGPPGYAYGPGTNTLAIASLVSAIVGFPLLFACYVGVAGWIAGIVLGIIALNQIKQTHQNGHGLAVAGIAVGGIALFLAAIGAILFFTLVVAAA
jgi:hypothetical protein